MRALSIALTLWMVSIVSAGEQQTAENAKEPPSWETLAQKAKDAEKAQFCTKDLIAQLNQKKKNLSNLKAQRDLHEAELVGTVMQFQKSLAEVESIDEEQLRNESLLRLNEAKRVRITTISVKLQSVNSEIEREEKEIALLQRILKGRQARARLYGFAPPSNKPYREYIAEEADRVRQSEARVFEKLRKEHIVKIEAVVIPTLKLTIPEPVEVVLEE